MRHVVLLGDSIFDNGAYVPGRPDVIAQLRDRLGPADRATLLAVDGDVTESVAGQLRGLPANATHLVVSVGGNDALPCIELAAEPAATISAALLRLGEVRRSFREAYAAMLDTVLARGLPLAVCTIYYPRFPQPEVQALAVAGLALFNDVILLEATAHGLPVLDLRQICDSDADYANPIEPSDKGGDKIASAIADLLARHDFASRRSVVLTGRS